MTSYRKSCCVCMRMLHILVLVCYVSSSHGGAESRVEGIERGTTGGATVDRFGEFLQQQALHVQPTDDESSVESILRRQCPSDGSVLDCYIRVTTLMRDPDLRGQIEAHLNNICPRDQNHFRCFFDYINNVLDIPQATRSYHGNQQDYYGDNVNTRKRALSRFELCPEHMATLDCFDSYMALWVKLVTSKEGKRTFAGKRGSDIYSGPDFDPDNQPKLGEDDLLSSDWGPTEGKKSACVEYFGREACLGKDIKQLATYILQNYQQNTKSAERKRSMASVCRDTDPVKCFEHYIFQLARYESQKQKVKGFIGK